MRILIDADGCPVVDITLRVAKRYGVECIIFCDTSHVFEIEGAETVVCSKGADSVDFAIVNRAASGDLVITQDYGLAGMCLARNAAVFNQDGLRYTGDNIDALLHSRHVSRKIRESGGRTKGPKKRARVQDEAFETALTQYLEGECG